MTLLLVKILVTGAAMQLDGVRAIGGRAGRGWSGLVMGLPSISPPSCSCSSAMRGGCRSRSGLIKGAILAIVAAVALPPAYAFAAGHRRTARWAPGLGGHRHRRGGLLLPLTTSLGVPSRLGRGPGRVALGSATAKVLQVSGGIPERAPRLAPGPGPPLAHPPGGLPATTTPAGRRGRPAPGGSAMHVP